MAALLGQLSNRLLDKVGFGPSPRRRMYIRCARSRVVSRTLTSTCLTGTLIDVNADTSLSIAVQDKDAMDNDDVGTLSTLQGAERVIARDPVRCSDANADVLRAVATEHGAAAGNKVPGRGIPGRQAMTAALEPHDFEAQVLTHLDALYAFVRRRLVDRSAAEDVLQEALLVAWEKRAQLRDADALRPWLYQVVLTSLYGYLRRHRRLVPVAVIEDVVDRHLTSEDPTPLEAILARVTHEQLGEALRQVPHDFALAVELADLERQSYREIAAILDVPIGTVMSRIYRGRRLLADVILRNREAWGLDEPAKRHRK